MSKFLQFNFFTRFIVFAFLMQFIYSCSVNDEECHENTEVNLNMNFYKRTITTTNTYKYSTLTLDSVWAKALDVDSFVYKNSKSKSQLLIPLKKFDTHCEYILRLNDKTDTLSIFYTNNDTYFISYECGCVVSHRIEEIITTNHFIDSISITNPEITTTNVENIKIYNW